MAEALTWAAAPDSAGPDLDNLVDWLHALIPCIENSRLASSHPAARPIELQMFKVRARKRAPRLLHVAQPSK